MQYVLSELIEKINQHIGNLDYPTQPEGLYAPIKYALSLGGKRIRPILTLMAYNLYKDNLEAVIPIATGIETYHNHTLLHDDVMDNADIRRGKPTVHKIWNTNTAILSGDAMLIQAFQHISTAPNYCLKEIIDLFATTALEICEGQQYDMDFESRNDVTEAEYIEMIRLKTAVLLACSLKAGAIAAGAPSKDCENLYQFGIHIGLAFQLQDDLLDVYGDSTVFGKKTGGDITSNKKTFMLIKALEMANKEEHAQLTHWIEAKDFVPEEKIKGVTAIYNQIGIRNICEEKMKEYDQKASQYLNDVAVSAERKKELHQLAAILMNRNS